MKNKVLFLDRDGVVNVDKNYIYKISDFEFMDGFWELIAEFKNRTIIIITNQSGIKRGYFSELDFKKSCDFLKSEFEKRGFLLKDIYFCPHLNQSCECRKPKPGMFIKAIKDHDLKLDNSIMIGDKASDMIAASLAKIELLFLLNANYQALKQELLDFHTIKAFDLLKTKSSLKELLEQKKQKSGLKTVILCKNHAELLALFKEGKI